MKGAIHSSWTVIYFLIHDICSTKLIKLLKIHRIRCNVVWSSRYYRYRWSPLILIILVWGWWIPARVCSVFVCHFRPVEYTIIQNYNNIDMSLSHFRVIRISRYEISGGEITNNISCNRGTGNPRLKFINAKFGSTSVILLFNSAAVLITYR